MAEVMASAPAEDPLLPWLRSIRQIKQSHPEDKSKLLPYVADCFREFQDNERYRNDLRFLRICIQYVSTVPFSDLCLQIVKTNVRIFCWQADCSPEPLKIVAELDERGMGHDHALFYEAYATCLEAKRRFGDANNVYKRGLSRQAQPAEKLINSYKLFRDRMDARKKRKQDQVEQHARKSSNIAEEGLHAKTHSNVAEDGVRQMEACQGGPELASRSHLLSTNCYTAEGLDMSFEELRLASMYNTVNIIGEQCVMMDDNCDPFSNPLAEPIISVPDRMGIGSFGEETIQIRNFAAKAITGKEKDVEDARHHGLVDPTINTKEALQDILSMFRKPLDIGKKKETGKSSKKQGLVSTSVMASAPTLDDNKKQSNMPPEDGLQAQPSEFSVFKDADFSEQDHSEAKPRSKSSEKAEDHLFSVYTDEKLEDDLPWVAKADQTVEESGFFVFKDEEVSEAEQEHIFSVYRDDSFQGKPKDGLHCNTILEKNHEGSDLFVFRDEESQRESLQERKVIMSCHDSEGKMSKGKALGANKSLAHGVENVLPQSPLC